MLQDIARVFSSQGVLVPGSEQVAVPDRRGPLPASGVSGPDGRGAGPDFDQASSKVELSARGRALQAADADEKSRGGAASANGKGADGKPLSEADEKTIRELAQRDRQVKAHEAAHQAAAGGQARGGANFEYQTGPDGKQYAVGGHVDIDVSPVQGNPRATLAKAMTAQRAALAPADPSGQDRAVAAAAAQMALQAQKEIAAGKGGDSGKGGEGGGQGPSGGGTGDAGADSAASARSQRVRAYGRATATGAALNVRA